MDKLIEIIANVIDIDALQITRDEENNIIEITNSIDSQVIVILSNADGIWVRLSDPNTGYFCETIEEFTNYIEALMTNKIEVCVGSKNGEWVETIIVPTHNHDEMQDDLDYSISYWAYPKNN